MNGWPQQELFQTVWFSYSHKLHFGQWSSLPFCLPSLIFQWSLLLVIVVVVVVVAAAAAAAAARFLYKAGGRDAFFFS